MLPVLRVLAGEEPEDPFSAAPAVLEAARVVNAARVARAQRDFVEHAAGCLGDLFRAGEWQLLEAWLGDIAGWRE